MLVSRSVSQQLQTGIVFEGIFDFLFASRSKIIVKSYSWWNSMYFPCIGS